MDAKELRIGNFVTDEFYESFKTIIEVDSISDKGINLQIEDDGNYPECAQRWIEPYYRFDVLRPIELTEEWLIKFGFKKRSDGDYNLLKYSEVDIVIDRYFDGWKCDGVWFSVNRLEYVHQLQNLYFALTGEELKLN